MGRKIFGVALFLALLIPALAEAKSGTITYRGEGTSDPQMDIDFDVFIRTGKRVDDRGVFRVQDVEARNVFFKCNDGITQRGDWPFVQDPIDFQDDGDFRGTYNEGVIREVLTGTFSGKGSQDDLDGKLARMPMIKGVMILETGTGCKSGRVEWKARPVRITGGIADNDDRDSMLAGRPT